MKEGWIQLHRRLAENPIWSAKPFSKGQAWVDLLLMANWKDEHVMLGNEIIECKRGQSLRSLDTWAKRWGWSKSAVRRFFGLLTLQSMIVTEDVRKSTRLTICNYETYQELRNADETRAKRERNADETQLAPIEQRNKETREQEENGAPLVPSVPPAISLQTNEGKEFPITQSLVTEYSALYPAVDVMAELRKMRAWLISNPKNRKTATGMLRFVNTWLSREQDKGGKKLQPPQSAYGNKL